MKQETQFLEVVSLIRQSRNRAYQAVNSELINCYWQVGEYISRRLANAVWGDKSIDDLARFIEKSHPDLKGYNRRCLYRMKQFYDTYYTSPIVSPVVTQLQNAEYHGNKMMSPPVTQLSDIRNTILAQIGWTHHLIIFTRTKTAEEREFYIKACIQERYSKRELDRQISSGLFERIMLGKHQLSSMTALPKKDALDVFKSDYILEFLQLPANHNESDLQKALVAQMKQFILELGKDFLFMGQEYRIQVGNSDFVIDLPFFHRGL
jgi:predicted nuclease of restriction endonuclease-like (RecB) superfamily